VVFSYARSQDKLARVARGAGHNARAGTPREAVFSYARSQDKLARVARGAGHNARAGTPREAEQEPDVIQKRA